MRKTKTPRLIRPLVEQLHAYVPGEQPRIKGLIKLNTNENPYPPSPKVLAAIRAAVDQRLRLYPNATAQPLRERLARLHRCDPENIIIGNGSDELLALATRAFVEPSPRLLLEHENRRTSRQLSAELSGRSTVQFFTPSYSLYPVLAAIHGAESNPVPLGPGFDLPSRRELASARIWRRDAALTLITTPNAPSGRGYPTKDLETICRLQKGVVILDEAYVDFAEENALRLGLELPNVLISRTFSKAYSLCFQRVGYMVGPSNLIAALDKIRDSYNVNGLGQIGALATLSDLPYYRRNFRRVIATRERLSEELRRLGFQVLPSQTNFIFVRPPALPAQDWLAELRRRKILVRWFDTPVTKDFLRITIGSDPEANALLRAAKQILHG